RTFNLIQSSSGGNFTHDPQRPDLAGLNFAVNQLSGDQIVISSNAGRVFATSNQGRLWFVIGQPAALDGTNADALAFGAPDPNGPNGGTNLNDFVYAGTIAGNMFVTFTGGGTSASQWVDI